MAVNYRGLGKVKVANPHSDGDAVVTITAFLSVVDQHVLSLGNLLYDHFNGFSRVSHADLDISSRDHGQEIGGRLPALTAFRLFRTLYCAGELPI